MAQPALPSTADEPLNFYEQLFGALNEAPEDDQPKILKAFLLDCIETMREHTLMQLDLLEKLGSLALDNVQDVRLYSLEARIKELEQGKPITFGALIGEVFFAIALEGAILAGVTSAAPALASVGALVITSIRSSVRSPVMARRLKAFKPIAQHRDELVAAEARLLPRLQPRFNREQRRRLGIFKERRKLEEEVETLQTMLQQVNVKYEFALQQIGESLAMRSSSGFASKRQNILEIRFSKGIERLINDYAHHVDAGKSVGRSIATTARQQYPQVFAATSAGGPTQSAIDGFTTTHSVLQLIATCESLKLDVSAHFRQMRAIVDAVDAADTFDAFETVLVMEELENNLFETIAVTEDMIENLQEFVVPMELAIWLTYLESNNVLTREIAPVRRTAPIHGQSKASTRFIGNDFVENVVSTTSGVTDSPRTLYEGRRYEGLHALDENQAYYLFHQFAKHSFDQFADRIPVSKAKELTDFIHRDVREDAFADVLALPKVTFWTGENPERVNLTKEMAVVVIEYFIHVRERLASQNTVGFSDAVPAGTKIEALLNNIERPVHAEQSVAPMGPPLPPEVFLEQQEQALLEEWEARVLTMLSDREYEYDRALGAHQLALVAREEFNGTLPEAYIESFIVGQAVSQLSKARSSLEQSIGVVKFDEQRRTTDAVEAAIETLEHKVAECPIEGEMFDRLREVR